MNLHNGLARVTIIGVAIVELILVGVSFHAWAELSEAEQRLITLPVPASPTESDQTVGLNGSAISSPEETVRAAAEDSARMDYEYAAATVVTRRGELYL